MALLRPAPGRIRLSLLFAAPPPARSGRSVVSRAPWRRDGLEEERKRAASVSIVVSNAAAADADDAGATSTSPFEEPSEETAELRLEALGLSHASSRRLVRRAAALRKRFRASGGSGNGSSGGSGSGSSSSDDSDGGGGGGGEGTANSNAAASRGSRRAPSTPTAADVDAAAKALLDVGFRISEVAAAMERAPGLLNASPGGIERRAASFLQASSSSPDEAEKAAAAAATTSRTAPPPSPAIFRSTLVRILRHRPAALCARSAEKGLRASLAALRSLGATPRSLSRLAREDPSAFWRRPADFFAAAEALSAGIAGCPAKVIPRLLCEHPRALLGPAAPSSSLSCGSSSSSAAAAAVARALDWLRSPPLSLPPERAAAVLAAEPALVARERDELDAVAAALASAGVSGSEDLAALVEAWPRILTKKAADVGVKARLATEVLGAAPRALARSPRLLFDRSVSGSIGPRFAFYRARRGAGAGAGGGSSDGEEEEEEEVGSERGQDGKNPSSSSSSSSVSSSSLSPSTLLRGGDTDFCLAVGGYYSLPATEEEFSIFRRRWEAEAERGLVAEGLAEERKRLSRREQRQRRRQRRSEEAEAEAAEGEREEAASTAAAEVAAAAAVAAALAARNLQQKQQQRKQQRQRKEQQQQKPEAAGAALEAIATLRTKKKEGGGGGQK